MAQDPLKTAIENAKKLKLSYLDLLPALAAIARGEGVAKAAWEGIKWGAIAAAVPVAAQLGYVFFGLGSVVKALVRDSGALDAAIQRIGQIKGLERLFAPLLGGVAAAKLKIAELIDFSNKSPFSLGETGAAARNLQILAPQLATPHGLKLAGEAAAGTGNELPETAGAIGSLHRKLELGGDITSDVENMRQLGLVTEQTAKQIIELQQAGAGFSTVWNKVEDGLQRFSGSMRSMRDEIGQVESRFEKAQQNFAAAFGAPFVDAHKQGIKSYTAALQNIQPAAQAVAKSLAQVTGVTSTIKSKIYEFVSATPRLKDMADMAAKMAIAFGGIGSAVGAGQLVKRWVLDIPRLVKSSKAAAGVDNIADVVGELSKNLSGQAAFARQQAEIAMAAKALAKKDPVGAATKYFPAGQAPADVLGVLSARSRQAQVDAATATVKSFGAKAANAAITPIKAIGQAVAAAFGFVGRLLINPVTIGVGAVAAVTAGIWSLHQRYRESKAAVDDFNKSARETNKILREQIANVVTLNDKHKAVIAAQNAVNQLREKRGDLKLPSAETENQKTIPQKLRDYLVQHGLPIYKAAAETLGGGAPPPQLDIEKSESKGQMLKRAEARQERRAKDTLKLAKAIPEDNLLTEEHLELVGQRAVFERGLEEVQFQTQLQQAPTAASQQAMLEKRREVYKERVQSAEDSVEKRSTLEKSKPFVEATEQISKGQQKINNAEKIFDELASKNEKSDKLDRQVQEAAQKYRTKNPALSPQQATMQAYVDELKAAEKTGTTGGLSPVDYRERARGIKLYSEGTPLITKGREQQDKLITENGSELDKLAVRKRQIDEQKIHATREEQEALKRETELRKQEEKELPENRGREAEAGIQAQIREREKRLQAPDIQAEREILGIRSEGLEREEQIAAVIAKQNQEKLKVLHQDEAYKNLPPEEFEKTPEVLGIHGRQRELERGANQRDVQRSQIEFSKRSLGIEATTGTGPDEAIRALKEQLTLTEKQMVAVKELHAQGKLSTEETEQQTIALAAQHNEQRKTLDSLTLQRKEQVDAARSETLQLGYSVSGQDALAQLEATRLSYAQQIAAAIKDQNEELANQLRTQRNLSVAAQLGGLLSRSPAEIKDDQDKEREQTRKIRLGQGALSEARDRMARGVKFDASDPILGFLRADDEERAKEAKQQVEAQKAERERIAREAGIKESATGLGVTPEVGEKGIKTPAEIELAARAKEREAAQIVTDQKPATEQQKTAAQNELTVEAAPFKQALDSSERLKDIAGSVERTAKLLESKEALDAAHPGSVNLASPKSDTGGGGGGGGDTTSQAIPASNGEAVKESEKSGGPSVPINVTVAKPPPAGSKDQSPKVLGTEQQKRGEPIATFVARVQAKYGKDAILVSANFAGPSPVAQKTTAATTTQPAQQTQPQAPTAATEPTTIGSQESTQPVTQGGAASPPAPSGQATVSYPQASAHPPSPSLPPTSQVSTSQPTVPSPQTQGTMPRAEAPPSTEASTAAPAAQQEPILPLPRPLKDEEKATIRDYYSAYDKVNAPLEAFRKGPKANHLNPETYDSEAYGKVTETFVKGMDKLKESPIGKRFDALETELNSMDRRWAEEPSARASQTKVTGVTFTAPAPVGPKTEEVKKKEESPLVKAISENPKLYPEFKKVFGKEPTAEVLSGINLNSLDRAKMSSGLSDTIRREQQTRIGQPSEGAPTGLATAAVSAQNTSGSALGGATPPKQTALGPGLHVPGSDDVMGPQAGHMGKPTHMAPLGTGEGGRPETAKERETKRTAKEEAVRDRNAAGVTTPEMVAQEAVDNATHHEAYADIHETTVEEQVRGRAMRNKLQQLQVAQAHAKDLESKPQEEDIEKYRTPAQRASDEEFQGRKGAWKLVDESQQEAAPNATTAKSTLVPAPTAQYTKRPEQEQPQAGGMTPDGMATPASGSFQIDPWNAYRMHHNGITDFAGGNMRREGQQDDPWSPFAKKEKDDSSSPYSPLQPPDMSPPRSIDLATPATAPGARGEGGAGGDNSELVTILTAIQTQLQNLGQQIGTF